MLLHEQDDLKILLETGWSGHSALLKGLVLSGFIKKLVSLCKGILHACGHQYTHCYSVALLDSCFFFSNLFWPPSSFKIKKTENLTAFTLISPSRFAHFNHSTNAKRRPEFQKKRVQKLMMGSIQWQLAFLQQLEMENKLKCQLSHRGPYRDRSIYFRIISLWQYIVWNLLDCIRTHSVCVSNIYSIPNGT